MVTKEQERKALAKIEAILAELGEDSYVATAMAGMVEDAKQNIENDWAMSYKDRFETMQAVAAQNREEADMLQKQLDEEIIRRQSAEAKVLSTRENVMIQNMLQCYKNVLADRSVNFKSAVLENCLHPEKQEFKEAAANYKMTEEAIENIDKMKTILDNQIKPIQ